VIRERNEIIKNTLFYFDVFETVTE